MMTGLKSPRSPGGVIYVSITDYNFQDEEGNPHEPTKLCRMCGRTIPLGDFLVGSSIEVLKGRQYAIYHDTADNVCRKCRFKDAEEPEFNLFYHPRGKKVMIRFRFHDEHGRLLWLVDPKTKKRQLVIERGVRLMDKKNPGDVHILRLQPYPNRAHDHEGNKYGEE